MDWLPQNHQLWCSIFWNIQEVLCVIHIMHWIKTDSNKLNWVGWQFRIRKTESNWIKKILHVKEQVQAVEMKSELQFTYLYHIKLQKMKKALNLTKEAGVRCEELRVTETDAIKVGLLFVEESSPWLNLAKPNQYLQ